MLPFIKSIAEIFKNPEYFSSLDDCQIQGWIKSVRITKEVIFFTINDGSTVLNLQAVAKKDLIDFSPTYGSFVVANGKIILTPNLKQNFELKITEISLYNEAEKSYPLQKKNLTLQFLRNYPQLRAKTSFSASVYRLRNTTSQSFHLLLQKWGFIQIFAPILTNSDAEGAGESFQLLEANEKKRFFGFPVNLTVSAQLQTESLTQGLNRVYSLAPCFRAEYSDTFRHLAEFWMLELEMLTENLSELIILTENLLKETLKTVIEKQKEEIEFLEKYYGKEIIKPLVEIFSRDFKIISYQEAIILLEKHKDKFKNKNIEWGLDLKSEHENFLCELFGGPIFITHYPAKLKAFYMKKSSLYDDSVDCFDLIFPRVGEIAGGSLRENNYLNLVERIEKLGIKQKNLEWYTDLRKFGYGSTGGFGIGLERIIMIFLVQPNIRDVIPFPRYYNHCLT